MPSAAIGGLMFRYGNWALITGLVWAVLSLLMTLAFLLPGLAYVNSFFDFGFTVPVIVSIVVAVVAAVVAIVQSRRGTVRTVSTQTERRVSSS